MAEQRLGEKGLEKMRGLLRGGDPYGQVAVAWEAKEAVRELHGHQDQALALEWIDSLCEDLTDKIRPPEVRSLGRTLKRWRLEITAWPSASPTFATIACAPCSMRASPTGRYSAPWRHWAEPTGGNSSSHVSVSQR